MVAPINPTQLTPPRVDFIDPRSGAISREWYRFFLSLLTATQTNQQETELAPDTASLLASYDTVFGAAIEGLESAPDCCSEAANVDVKTNTLAQATGVAPPSASEDEIAVIQAELQALALAPPAQPAAAPAPAPAPAAISGFWAATVARLTGTQASSVVALGDVTQLVGALAANAVYLVDCFVTFRSAATTTGLNLGFTSPTGTVCQLEVVVPVTSTAAATQLRTVFPSATATNTGNVLGTGVTAINSDHTARISGIVICGATPGNFQVRFASEVAASAVTLQTGSSLIMQRIA